MALQPWLYRIATNACLDELATRKSRPMPMAIVPPADPNVARADWPVEPTWLEPVPDAWLAGVARDPGAIYDTTVADVCSPVGMCSCCRLAARSAPITPSFARRTSAGHIRRWLAGKAATVAFLAARPFRILAGQPIVLAAAPRTASPRSASTRAASSTRCTSRARDASLLRCAAARTRVRAATQGTVT